MRPGVRYIIFEYELPRDGGYRPGVVILTCGTVLVLEFMGYSATSPDSVTNCRPHDKYALAVPDSERLF